MDRAITEHIGEVYAGFICDPPQVSLMDWLLEGTDWFRRVRRDLRTI